MRKYAITAVLSLMFLTGCGGTGNGAGSLPKPTAACVNGFRNDAGIPTGESGPVVALSPTSSTLWNLWNAAQHDLSTEPIPYLDGHTEPPIVACATVQPDCQAVVAVPDLTDQQLAEWAEKSLKDLPVAPQAEKSVQADLKATFQVAKPEEQK